MSWCHLLATTLSSFTWACQNAARDNNRTLSGSGGVVGRKLVSLLLFEVTLQSVSNKILPSNTDLSLIHTSFTGKSQQGTG